MYPPVLDVTVLFKLVPILYRPERICCRSSIRVLALFLLRSTEETLFILEFSTKTRYGTYNFLCQISIDTVQNAGPREDRISLFRCNGFFLFCKYIYIKESGKEKTRFLNKLYMREKCYLFIYFLVYCVFSFPLLSLLCYVKQFMEISVYSPASVRRLKRGQEKKKNRRNHTTFSLPPRLRFQVTPICS